MILHHLVQYYQRKNNDANSDVAPEGFEFKEIPFMIVINEQGKFITLEDTRSEIKKNKKNKGAIYLVPKAEGRSGSKSYETSNILWDHYGYVLAEPKEVDNAHKLTPEKLKEEIEKNEIAAINQHNSFKKKVAHLHQQIPEDKGIAAVWLFLQDDEEKAKVKLSGLWEECKKIKGCNISFRLSNEITNLVCQSQELKNYLENLNTDEQNNLGICLVTGEKTEIGRLHDDIKGLSGQPTSFASVNLDSAESYGKTQGFVFPVGKKSIFEYTTALTMLLDSKNRLRIGEVSAVCWSAKSNEPLENKLVTMLLSNKDNPDEHIAEVKELYNSINDGRYSQPDDKNNFYLLGLSSNSKRIVVRFWHETTVANLSKSIAQWYDDLCMIHKEHDPNYPDYLPLPKLLGNLVLEGKIDKLSSDIVVGIMQSALDSRIALSHSVLQTVLRRNKAEQKVTYARAALIKAYLNRRIRRNELNNIKEINMALDRDRSDIGYILGRLFAVLNQIQKFSADSKINATIVDRYFGAASSTPVAVFGTLLRLSQHHLAKLRKGKLGSYVVLNKELSEIINKCQSFPNHLNLEQQGLFAIGFYHETQFLFTKDAFKTIKVDNLSEE